MILLAGATLATFSCHLLLDLEEPRGVVRPPPEIDATVDPCTHAAPPAPPTVEDPSSTEHAYWFAADRLLPVGTDADLEEGVDLDQACTCGHDLFDGAAPCETPAGTRTACDLDGGVDNSLGRVVRQYASLAPGYDTAQDSNRHIERGSRTSLLYLEHYNGKANDGDISIAMITATGLYDTDAGGCNGEPRDAGPWMLAPDGAPGPQVAPLWDGCDRWSVPSSTVTGSYPNRHPITLVGGWVTNFTVVARIKDGTLDMAGRAVRLRSVVGVLHLISDGTGFRGQGFVAGRILFGDLVNLVGSGTTVAPGGLKRLCDTPSWNVLGPQLCATLDTMDSPSLDHRGEICNAATAKVGFTVRQAQVSDSPFEGQDPEPPCGFPGQTLEAGLTGACQ